MAALRTLWRASALVGTTGVLYVIYLPVLLLLSPWPGTRRRWRNGMFQLWARLVSSIVGMVIEVEGDPPEAPFFLVANHLSYLDVVVLTTRLPAVFVAKAEVRQWPVLGILCRSLGTIFVERSARRDVVRVNRGIKKTLAEGFGVVLFPEGTSTEGSGVGPFKPALLAYPAEERLPVHHASVSYSTPPDEPPAHLVVCWWGDMTFGRHFLDLLRVSRFNAKLMFGPTPVQDSDRKRLATRLQQSVVGSFVPVVESTIRAPRP